MARMRRRVRIGMAVAAAALGAVLGTLAFGLMNNTGQTDPANAIKNMALAQAAPAPAPNPCRGEACLAQSPSPSEPPAPAVTLEPACLRAPTNAQRLPTPALPKQLTGRVGLYIARFAAGQNRFEPEMVVSLNSNMQFPLASNFKTPIAYELVRQIQAGRIKPSEKFTVTKANQSLGKYPYDGSSATELATRMITWSDNTATDILFRRIGLESLQPHAMRLGLCQTRLLLPTKAWWTAQAGLGGPDFPKYGLVKASQTFANAPYDQQLAIAKRLDNRARAVHPDLLYRAADQYFAGRNGGVATMSEIDRNLQNASTPAQWARLMFYMFTENDLTPKYNKIWRDIMYHGAGRGYLRVPFSYYGGKSGNTAHILTYSGYLESKDGRRYIYVYMNDTSQTQYLRPQTPLAFAVINQALKKLMPKPAPKPVVKPSVQPSVQPSIKPTTPFQSAEDNAGPTTTLKSLQVLPTAP
jgi:beta-lactamase class A